MLGLAVAAILLLIAGAGLGFYWASRVESATVNSLRATVASLEEDRDRVGVLAERLLEVEERYARLQAAVTEGRPESGPLPPVPFAPATVAPGLDPAADEPAWPLARSGFVTRTFGSRTDTRGAGHTGVDIAVPTGSYVRAILSGVVRETGHDSVYGRFIRIAHADGLASLYGHNSWLFASPGDSVDRLQVIALSGNTGRSTAPHLHLELTEEGSLVDPLGYVSENRSRARTSGFDDGQPR